MKPTTRLVAFTALAVFALAAVAPLVAPGGQPCMSCHSGDKPSSDYRFTLPTMRLVYPSAAPPGRLINVTMVLDHAGRYSVVDEVATLELSGPGTIAPNRPSTTALSSISASGGTSRAVWSVLTGNQRGTLSLTAKLNLTASRAHTNDDSHDSSRFMMVRTGALSVRPMDLFVGAGEVLFGGPHPSTAQIEVLAIGEVRNLTVSPSVNVAGAVRLAPTSVARVAAGQGLQFEVEARKGSAGVVNGRIELAWENATGYPDSTFVAFGAPAPRAPVPAVGTGPLRLTGRVTGIVSLGILISAMALGRVRLKCGWRLRVHCALAWFIVGLGTYHGLMLVLGPYSDVAWTAPVLLGYAAAATMIVAGSTGIVRPKMCRLAGVPAWRWTHRLSLATAIVLVIVHSVMMGTDTAFIRAALPGL